VNRQASPYPAGWSPPGQHTAQAFRRHVPEFDNNCLLNAHWFCRLAERVHERDLFAQLVKAEIEQRGLVVFQEPPKISWR
jgi:hypothetical protein